jgi:CDP-glucose 4,6-dehydratase
LEFRKGSLEALVDARSEFWRERSVFLTGHTGFKGGWLALALDELGAKVHGFALQPATVPSLYESVSVSDALSSEWIADLRDRQSLVEALERAQPEIIFHLAAQSLVRVGYGSPVETFSVNVMGTAEVLDAARRTPSVRAIVVVTTDKVYENREDGRPFRELDPLGAHDPYSTSKAATELVVAGYRASYFFAGDAHVNVATARAGNVIGGGDWAADRLVPDCIRAFSLGQPVTLRRPDAIRPWQHVLEPLSGYLRLGEQLLSPDGSRFARAWNFGPESGADATVERVATAVAMNWGEEAEVRCVPASDGLVEATSLRLDSTDARVELGWTPRWSLNEAIERAVRWYHAQRSGADMSVLTRTEIREYDVTGSH